MAITYSKRLGRLKGDDERTKRLVRETACVGGTLVVTAEYSDGSCETRVIGGALDGWLVPSEGEPKALETHRGAVTLCNGADSGLIERN